MQNFQDLKPAIEQILQPLKDKGFFVVVENIKVMSSVYLRFYIASSEKTIHNVNFQHPDLISFWISEDLELKPQMFGGCGGGQIYRNIDPTIEKEKYYAMKGEKIPFRTPKKDFNSVLKAVERLKDNYIKTLKNIQSRGLLRYSELTDYNKLLN